MKIGQGIFIWSAPERRTQRYGLFWMGDETFDSQVKCEPYFDYDTASTFLGKNVKLSCKVLDSRPSGHAGDKLIEIMPSQPAVGEIVEIGIGPCCLEADEHAPGGFAIGIRPTGNRERYWVDPRKFFRLHDQTVELFIELSDEPESHDPTPFLKHVDFSKPVAISNGDGTLQFYGIPENGQPVTVKPKIEKLFSDEEGGCFSVKTPGAMGNAGEQFEIAQ